MPEKPSYEELEQKVEALERERRQRETTVNELREIRTRYERLISTIPCVLYDYVRWPDGTNRFIYISPQCSSIFGVEAEAVTENSELLWNMVHPEDMENLKQQDVLANRAGEMFQSEVRIIMPDCRVKWIQLTSMPGVKQVDSRVVWSGVILDITQRREAEEERNQLLLNLRGALAEVKTLRGIIPICSYCKKIRDDKGFWNQVEAYISRHSEAELSHGICPDCAKIYYPDMNLYD